VTEVFDPVGQQTRERAFYPEDRAAPVHATDNGVQVRLDQFELRRPRQWGVAGCCHPAACDAGRYSALP
jgi:hypothetical protein